MNKIYGKKLLEFANLTPDEVRAVMDEEEQNMTQSGMMQGMATGISPDAPNAPVPPEVPQGIATDTMQLTPQMNAQPA